jgi:hypothetical protein
MIQTLISLRQGVISRMQRVASWFERQIAREDGFSFKRKRKKRLIGLILFFKNMPMLVCPC